MKIRILKSAQEDLREGYWFYECQEAGLGDYFLDSLNSDIESLNKNLITHVIPAVSGGNDRKSCFPFRRELAYPPPGVGNS